jgi:hypothetical protein
MMKKAPPKPRLENLWLLSIEGLSSMFLGFEMLIFARAGETLRHVWLAIINFPLPNELNLSSPDDTS